MLKNKLLTVLFATIIAGSNHAQTLKLETIIDSIISLHPVVKMYDNEIRSMDEAAKGARSWMPPQVGVGQFMTPYNVRLWRREGDMQGMGSVMVSGEQMFPNKRKLDADERYMKAMSSVEKEKRNATLNELISDAKQSYYEWIVLKKKLVILGENEQILEFMIKNAEIRYKNGLEKISAYYKARAALGNIKNMQLMFDAEIREKRLRINTLMGRNALIDFNIDTGYALKDYSGIVFDSALFYT
ncbi:MAG: TolC family protein, partial [Daejeonella sp.]